MLLSCVKGSFKTALTSRNVYLLLVKMLYFDSGPCFLSNNMKLHSSFQETFRERLGNDGRGIPLNQKLSSHLKTFSTYLHNNQSRVGNSTLTL